MTGHDIIVIGASAGGIQTLQELLGALPENLPASLFIVVHTPASASGGLATVLDRAGALPVETAADHSLIRHGRVYVSPPDHHLLVMPNRMLVTRGPKENGFRPAVDPLFRTAARAYRGRVIGVILSGGLDDGTSGLMYIKQQRGITVVQNPEEATFASMPLSAIQNVEVDYVLSVAQIAPLLAQLVHEPLAKGVQGMANSKDVEPDIAEIGTAALETHTMKRPPSSFTCPDCGGALWEVQEGKLIRYRCHNGHGYTAKALLEHQNENLEAAMWTALRVLEENAEMRRRMAERASAGNLGPTAEKCRSLARDAEASAAVLRKLLIDSDSKQVRKMPGLKPSRANRDEGFDRKLSSESRGNGRLKSRKKSPSNRSRHASGIARNP